MIGNDITVMDDITTIVYSFNDDDQLNMLVQLDAGYELAYTELMELGRIIRGFVLSNAIERKLASFPGEQ